MEINTFHRRVIYLISECCDSQTDFPCYFCFPIFSRILEFENMLSVLKMVFHKNIQSKEFFLFSIFFHDQYWNSILSSLLHVNGWRIETKSYIIFWISLHLWFGAFKIETHSRKNDRISAIANIDISLGPWTSLLVPSGRESQSPRVILPFTCYE